MEKSQEYFANFFQKLSEEIRRQVTFVEKIDETSSRKALISGPGEYEASLTHEVTLMVKLTTKIF